MPSNDETSTSQEQDNSALTDQIEKCSGMTEAEVSKIKSTISKCIEEMRFVLETLEQILKHYEVATGTRGE